MQEITKPGISREALFCDLCAQLGDPVEAAVKAGYPAATAAKTAARLLADPDNLARLDIRLSARRRLAESRALEGLCRLAFGGCNDAAKLLALGDSADEKLLDKLDLFGVSEIRREKDGGYSVRLYDRMKAMELLLDHSGADSLGQGAGSLFAALEQSARALSGREESEPGGI